MRMAIHSQHRVNHHLRESIEPQSSIRLGAFWQPSRPCGHLSQRPEPGTWKRG